MILITFSQWNAGSNTGVYVGNCFSDYHNGVCQNISAVNGYENVGSANSMSANKISYFFDFTGPSIAVDTACSSSLVALDRACAGRIGRLRSRGTGSVCVDQARVQRQAARTKSLVEDACGWG